MFDGIEELGFSNRDLLAQIRRATNHARTVYADWCPIKLRAYGQACAPKNRIDNPTDKSWVIARDNDDPVSFQTAVAPVSFQTAVAIVSLFLPK